MTHSSTPMDSEPSASQRPLPVILAMTTPKSARNRPISAPESSRSTTGSSGDFERRMKPQPRRLPRNGLRLVHGGAEREPLEDDGADEDADGPPERLRLVGVAQLLDALVDGEGAAEEEQHQGDDEAPEVALAPVAEGVRRRGLPCPPGGRRRAAGPGCRCRPASARPRRGGWPTASRPSPTNLMTAMPRLASSAAMMALRLPSCTAVGWHSHLRAAIVERRRDEGGERWDSSTVGWRSSPVAVVGSAAASPSCSRGGRGRRGELPARRGGGRRDRGGHRGGGRRRPRLPGQRRRRGAGRRAWSSRSSPTSARSTSSSTTAASPAGATRSPTPTRPRWRASSAPTPSGPTTCAGSCCRPCAPGPGATS